VHDGARALGSSPHDLVGKTVKGKYRLEECIGLGATSAVFRAHSLRHQRDVAFKLLLGESNGFGQIGARFRQEAASLAELRHCGVAELLDDGVTEDGAPYIAMELLRGKTLCAHLADYGRLTPRDAVLIAIRVARILDKLHERGLIHRDVKPANIFLETSHAGRTAIRLLDLGSARRLRPSTRSATATQPGLGGPDPSTARTLPGLVLGTPEYMSPEQCTAGSEPDPRSDIYSLGVVVYELLAGAPPFGGRSPSSILNAHLFFHPPALATRGVHVPESLEKVVFRALEKEPSARYDSVGPFACALADGARDADKCAPNSATR
jgi:serine/threonine-protein kinase